MGQGSPFRIVRTDADGRTRAAASVGLGLAIGLMLAGCGESSPSTKEPVASTGGDSMFQLPPGFKTVDIPLDKRKDVFKEAHGIRALAVQEANLELPMDEASLPVGNTAFEKRVADHKAIIDRVLNKNLAALAEKYKISVADVEKIEEEARRLRWLPPQEPVFEAEPQGADRKVQGEDGSSVEKK